MTVQTDLMALATIKSEIDALNQKKAEIEERMIAAMSKQGTKTVTAQGGAVKGTLVAGTRITIDEDALKKALSAAQWKKVTKQVLDKERLEAHIVTGDVDPNVVAAASTEKDTKPYIRVSGKLEPTTAGTSRKVRPAKPRA